MLKLSVDISQRFWVIHVFRECFTKKKEKKEKEKKEANCSQSGYNRPENILSVRC